MVALFFFVSQTYMDNILDLWGMKHATPVATWVATIAKTLTDAPLSAEECSVYRSAVGKLL